jgi:cytochrome c biogenesis protein CcdA
MLLMALQTWEIYDFIPSSNIMVSSKERGVLGALLAGVLGGFFASPCATPVLVVLLTMVAKKGNLLWGILLLLLYSIGHSFLVVAAGTSFGFVQRLSTNERYGIVSNLLKFFMGVAIVVIAFYMFYLGF